MHSGSSGLSHNDGLSTKAFISGLGPEARLGLDPPWFNYWFSLILADVTLKFDSVEKLTLGVII